MIVDWVGDNEGINGTTVSDRVLMMFILIEVARM